MTTINSIPATVVEWKNSFGMVLSETTVCRTEDEFLDFFRRNREYFDDGDSVTIKQAVIEEVIR